MSSQPTPRHRAAAPAPTTSRAAAAPARPTSTTRRAGGPFARHLRSGPRAAVTGGVVAALLLGPPLGLTAATMTGAVGPEHVGPLGPVVAALPWHEADAQTWLDGRDPRDDRASRTLAHGRDEDALGPVDAPSPDAAPTPGDESPAPDDPTYPAADARDDAAGTPPAEDATDPVPSTEPADAPDDAAPSTAPAPERPAPRAGATRTTTAAATEADAVVALTNAERAAAGCAPLAVDDRLVAAAQLHSEDMAANDYMDHTSLDGRSPWDRAKAQGYPNPGAENVAKGYRTAEDVVRAWMDSPGHRANILSCDLREIGVGHADGAWTQLFGWG